MSDNALHFIPPDVLDLIPSDVQQSIVNRITASRNAPTVLGFPFPAPTEAHHIPTVQHAGFDYVCTGCGEHIPDGARITETTEGDMVVGLRVIAGSDPEGPVIHECGQVR